MLTIRTVELQKYRAEAKGNLASESHMRSLLNASQNYFIGACESMSPEITVREAIEADCEAVFPLAKAIATSFDVEKAAFILSFSDISRDPAAVSFADC